MKIRCEDCKSRVPMFLGGGRVRFYCSRDEEADVEDWIDAQRFDARGNSTGETPCPEFFAIKEDEPRRMR